VFIIESDQLHVQPFPHLGQDFTVGFIFKLMTIVNYQSFCSNAGKKKCNLLFFHFQV